MSPDESAIPWLAVVLVVLIVKGAHDHLGVFFWATGSIKDRYVGRAGLDAIRIAANRKNANSLAVDAA